MSHNYNHIFKIIFYYVAGGATFIVLLEGLLFKKSI